MTGWKNALLSPGHLDLSISPSIELIPFIQHAPSISCARNMTAEL